MHIRIQCCFGTVLYWLFCKLSSSHSTLFVYYFSYPVVCVKCVYPYTLLLNLCNVLCSWFGCWLDSNNELRSAILSNYVLVFLPINKIYFSVYFHHSQFPTAPAREKSFLINFLGLFGYGLISCHAILLCTYLYIYLIHVHFTLCMYVGTWTFTTKLTCCNEWQAWNYGIPKYATTLLFDIFWSDS